MAVALFGGAHGLHGRRWIRALLRCRRAARLWDALLDAGAPDGLCPAGLGARDTLRLEKAYPLYGHELDDKTTPLEAGLAWVTKFSKPNFMGRDILMRQKNRRQAQTGRFGIDRAGNCAERIRII